MGAVSSSTICSVNLTACKGDIDVTHDIIFQESTQFQTIPHVISNIEDALHETVYEQALKLSAPNRRQILRWNPTQVAFHACSRTPAAAGGCSSARIASLKPLHVSHRATSASGGLGP